MRRFEATPRSGEGVAISIKVRVTSGCFHREHSPFAYGLIDGYLDRLPTGQTEFGFEEHESGPELLVYLAVATAGVTLGKSLVDLITAIIKARSEGVKKGDRPSDPIELIVRRVDDQEGFREEIVFRVGHEDHISQADIERRVNEALLRLIRKNRDS